jgi:hypothetical protein
MLLCKDLAIKIVFSILFLSSTGNDNKSMNAEHEFVPSFDTNNNIVSDVNHDVTQRQSKLQKSITDSFAESCSFHLTEYFEEVFSNFKEEQQFELHNITEQAKELHLTAERDNQRLFGKTSDNSSSRVSVRTHARRSAKVCIFFHQEHKISSKICWKVVNKSIVYEYLRFANGFKYFFLSISSYIIVVLVSINCCLQEISLTLASADVIVC